MREIIPQAGRGLVKASAPEGNIAGGHTRHLMMDDAKPGGCGQTIQMVKLS